MKAIGMTVKTSKHSFRRGTVATLAATICVVLAGCGYQVGSIMHPQVKTIAIAPVKNETLEPNVSALIRGALSEQFMVDGSLKVKSLETADCVLYGRVVSVETIQTAEDSYDADMTYRAAQWALQIKFEFVVLIPGRKKPLIPKRQVVGVTRYDVTSDHNIARRNGLKQACFHTAEDVVQYTTEAW